MTKLLLALVLSFPSMVQKPPQHPITPPEIRGHWVMAESGHAVYCTGPTVRLGGFNGELAYYGTGCIGPYGSVVKLHD